MRDRAEQIHTLILRAQGAMAMRVMQRWARLGVPREEAVKFARLSWRVSLPELGIRALHRVVRSTTKGPADATPEEIATYAHCLVKYGALAEGEALLRAVDPREVPRAFFYRASVCIARSDYAGSIPLLSRYVEAMREDEYEQAVGLTNLAAALVYERRFAEAETSLAALEASTRESGYSLLRGRVLELWAYNDMHQRHWPAARNHVDEAVGVLRAAQSLDEFLARKLAVVIDFQECADREATEALEAIRAEANARQHFETVRDCDRVRALIQGDEALLFRLYFGTPSPSYRARLLADAGRDAATVPARFGWEVGGSGGAIFDLATGRAGKEHLLEPGSVPHRLLSSICTDLYRPPRLAALFSAVYPDRHFNPDTSPALVYDAMIRARQAFRDHRLPLVIDEVNGFYSVGATAPITIEIPSEVRPLDRQVLVLKQLAEGCPPEGFTLGDAVKALSMPKRSVQRLLQRATEDRALVRDGHGTRTRYAFAPSR